MPEFNYIDHEFGKLSGQGNFKLKVTSDDGRSSLGETRWITVDVEDVLVIQTRLREKHG